MNYKRQGEKGWMAVEVGSENPRGFAVIATIAVLSLILMIALAMVSIATNTTKTEVAADYIEQAKANARLALNEAINSLQESMGPDQRVSANIGIIARDANGSSCKDEAFDPASGVDSNFRYPFLLGAWDSWTTWLSGDISTAEIASTYTEANDAGQSLPTGRETHFRKLLVSHPSSGSLDAAGWKDIARNGMGSVETVRLLGVGTLGKEAALIETLDGALSKVNDDGN